MQIVGLILKVQRFKSTLAATPADVDGRILIVRPRKANCGCAWAIDGCAEIRLSTTDWISSGDVVQVHTVRAAIGEFDEGILFKLMLERKAPELSLGNIDVLVHIAKLGGRQR